MAEIVNRIVLYRVCTTYASHSLVPTPIDFPLAYRVLLPFEVFLAHHSDISAVIGIDDAVVQRSETPLPPLDLENTRHVNHRNYECAYLV